MQARRHRWSPPTGPFRAGLGAFGLLPQALRLGLAVFCVLAGPIAVHAAFPADLGACGDADGNGRVVASDALAVLRRAVRLGDPAACIPLVCDTTGDADGVAASDARAVLEVAVGRRRVEALHCPSIARYWNEALLDAITLDSDRPPIHARTLFHLAVALWDAWAIHATADQARPLVTREARRADDDRSRAIAASYASIRLLEFRYRFSPAAFTIFVALRDAMAALGLDPDDTSRSGDGPVAAGNRIGAEILAWAASDGSNEADDYSDSSGYDASNRPLIVDIDELDVDTLWRWQPLALSFFFTQTNVHLPLDVQERLAPHWGSVRPFAEGADAGFDPGPPPLPGEDNEEEFFDGILEILRRNAALDPGVETEIDVSPALRGNNTPGLEDGAGHPSNPATGEPYASNFVFEADYGRVIAELWSRGSDGEGVAGFWNRLAHGIADHADFQRRIAGEGAAVDRLEWDTKLLIALNGALHDASVATAAIARRYDTTRPIGAVRTMAALGQSSLGEDPTFNARGLRLEDGLVEIVTVASSNPGERHAALRPWIGEIAVRGWDGRRRDRSSQAAGVVWLRARKWFPWQADDVVSPPSSPYVAEASALGHAAAAVLEALTGDAFFPGGQATFRARAGEFLSVEAGPSLDVALAWATYRDAADEAGLAGRTAGIHTRSDDLAGRLIGHEAGLRAWPAARALWNR